MTDEPKSRIQAFKKRYGDAHLRLAYHAAFPLSLTPELLYSLWSGIQNDQYNNQQETAESIPWLAVSDFLIASGFCNQVGHDLYEIQPDLRQELLQALESDPRFGTTRINELTEFTLAYAEARLHSAEPTEREFAQVQRWGALAYGSPQKAAKELSQALSNAYYKDPLNLNRIANIILKLTKPLYEYSELLTYAKGITQFVRGNQGKAWRQLNRLFSGNKSLVIEGVNLPHPVLPKFLNEIKKNKNSENVLLESDSHNTKNKRFSLNNSILISLVATLPVILFRALGILQPIELVAYDHLMRSRPAEWDTIPAIDSRLLVVEITESDIDRYGYPLSDEILSTGIENLQQYNPTTIGLITGLTQFQRNPPGREKLINQFQNFSNLVTACSVEWDDREILGHPPEFSAEQARTQVGFSDLETDDIFYFGTVRRQLLSHKSYLDAESSNCSTPYSFGMNLALRFLQAEGVQPLSFNRDNNWQLGSVIFKGLTSRAGAYQQLDGKTNQVLLNYRFIPKPVQRTSFTDVLENNLDDTLIRNRIVLVGVTDEPVGNDYRDTPYGSMPSVWVHAHGVSQILGAVLDERPLISSLPQWRQ